MFRNKIFLWIKFYQETKSSKWIISIAIDGLDNHFFLQPIRLAAIAIGNQQGMCGMDIQKNII